MGKSYTELRKEFEQEWAKNLKLYIKARHESRIHRGHARV